MSTHGAPDPMRYELDRASSLIADALRHVEGAARLAQEPEAGALQWLRADLGDAARRLGNLLKIAGRG